MGLVSAAWFTSLRPQQGSGNDPFFTTPENEQWILATNIEHLGLAPGDKFATVCCNGSASFKWAHLVHMHLVACFDWDRNFWQLREEDQRRVLAALDSTEAKVAVSEIPPPDPARAVGSQHIGLTQSYIHVLSAGRQQIARDRPGGGNGPKCESKVAASSPRIKNQGSRQYSLGEAFLPEPSRTRSSSNNLYPSLLSAEAFVTRPLPPEIKIPVPFQSRRTCVTIFARDTRNENLDSYCHS